MEPLSPYHHDIRWSEEVCIFQPCGTACYTSEAYAMVFEGQEVKDLQQPFVSSLQAEVMKNSYCNGPLKLVVITLDGKMAATTMGLTSNCRSSCSTKYIKIKQAEMCLQQVNVPGRQIPCFLLLSRVPCNSWCVCL